MPLVGLHEGPEPRPGILGGESGLGDGIADGGPTLQATEGREQVGRRGGEGFGGHGSTRLEGGPDD